MTSELTKAAPRNHGPINETDLYDFAGWLTTRTGVMAVGSSCEAGPMAEAVGEYIKTFPERFAIAQPPATLAAPAPAVPMSEVDLQDDDALRFAQRVLESDAPESDRKAARDMLVAIRIRVRKAHAALIAAPTPPAQSEPDQFVDANKMVAPVALSSVRLTRDTAGMCIVSVNGRVAIRDNGDIIDHTATREWFAASQQPAVPEDVAHDAQRYRWLRSRPLDWSVEHHTNGWSTCYGLMELDAAIDAARKAGGAA